MIFERPGYVTDRILLLGRKESCVYILKGNDDYALLGGGMVHIVPEILEQLKIYEIDEKKIQRILILHSHFDHCGIVPFFKKRWPWATVTASVKAKELLSTQRVVETIERLNQMLFRKYGREKEAETLKLYFTGLTVDAAVKEGDILECGDLKMEIIDVPGHSSCSIAVYVPQEKALFASDAGGIPCGNRIFTAANSNFDKYMNSLEKMASYEIKILLAEHFGARTGEDAMQFLEKSKASAKQTRHMMEASFARTKDEKKSAEEVTDLLMADAPKEFLPREVISLVVGQMIHYVAKHRKEIGMIKQIDHIEIIVKDVKNHVDFYQKLGFKLLKWTDHHGGSAELQLPGPNQPILEIHTVLGEENIGINHIAFQADDVKTTYEALSSKGIEFDGEPYRNRHTGRGNVRLRDPDGWRLQLCDQKRKEPETGIDEDSVVEAI